jgi:hypothetical protein
MIMAEISKAVNNEVAKYGTLKDVPDEELNDAVGTMTAFIRDFTNEKKRRSLEGWHIVRLYDGFDSKWIDVSKPMPKDEALKLAGDNNEKRTSGPGAGKREGSFDDIDYYAAFPADTVMRNRWK